jgi:Holliday junction resolvase-like predicted endonuclease
MIIHETLEQGDDGQSVLRAGASEKEYTRPLLKLERISKLGRLGEELVAERLRHHGFTNIENLNLRRRNYPFGDVLATRDGVRYFIGVKARNEMRQGDAGMNESYNLVLISDAAKCQTKGARQNT